ncbi:pilus assembly FimT family protein [Photobacterium swingsii]|uniref:pilus assembly FimT family protein n=1 Tax=Photobacterium swingsii TaxID=680026 RepID=UPI004068AFE5
MNMHKENGFTLIELIVVIVLVSTLSLIAWPRFFSIQVDSRIAAMNGLKASILTANEQVFGKSIIEGIDKLPEHKLVIDRKNNVAVWVRYGYPVWLDMSVHELLHVNLDEWFYGVNSGNEKEHTLRFGLSKIFNTPRDLMSDDAKKCFVVVKNTLKAVSVEVISDEC